MTLNKTGSTETSQDIFKLLGFDIGLLTLINRQLLTLAVGAVLKELSHKATGVVYASAACPHVSGLL